jgi:hypothetical protein
MKHTPYNFGRSSVLGFGHTPFMPIGSVKEDMVLNGITTDRLADRKTLLASIDRFRRDVDSNGVMEGFDSFQTRRFDILTSSRMLDALDLSSEDPKLRDRYGKGTEKEQGDAAPRLNEQFLLARRLIEAGVRVVTLSYSFWDWHGNNFKIAKENLPDFDQALSALIEDLDQRGMLDDTTVIAWGEFGRTPKINSNAGRDHWSPVMSALVAGGGMRMGQAVGSSTARGERPKDRPYKVSNLLATLYNAMGVDPATTFANGNGRPVYILDDRDQIPELVG